MPAIGSMFNLSRAIHARQRDSVKTVCRYDRGVQVRPGEFVRTDVVDLDGNVDRMLLPVTATIYQNGVEKPAMRWTFQMVIGAISDQTLHGFLQRLRGGFGIAERCSELTIRKFKVSLSTKDASIPKGTTLRNRLPRTVADYIEIPREH